MTEEEAKTKWCPFSRVIAGTRTGASTATASGTQPAFNRIEVGTGVPIMPDGSACIASSCMAWRWRRHKPKGWSETAPVPAEGGHCGLAGGE